MIVTASVVFGMYVFVLFCSGYMLGWASARMAYFNRARSRLARVQLRDVCESCEEHCASHGLSCWGGRCHAGEFRLDTDAVLRLFTREDWDAKR